MVKVKPPTTEIVVEGEQMTESKLSKNLINQILNDDNLLILANDM